MKHFLEFKKEGIFCKPGQFYLDPWLPVDYAIISHAHSDHARWGMKHYLCHHFTKPILHHRIGKNISVESIAYGEVKTINGVKVSLHPAGHIVGSSQIRMEYKGQVIVFSGDFKIKPDTLSTPFEPVNCHVFITESTFGLPIYKWKTNKELKTMLIEWVLKNMQNQKTSILVGYSLGKAQRILSFLEEFESVFVHSSIHNTNNAIKKAGIQLPTTKLLSVHNQKDAYGNIIIIPPSVVNSKMIQSIPNNAVAMCSGWMQIRGRKKWNAYDAGFPVSDHADWNGLISAVKETGAQKIFVTHGYQSVLSKYLNECGFNAEELITDYGVAQNETQQ